MKTSVFKNYKLVIFSVITIFLLIGKVNAATCTNETKNNLTKMAKTIEIIPYLNEEYNPMHVYVYNVSITNFNENVYITDSKGNRFEYDDSYTSDLLFGLYEPGEKVTFRIYGSYEGDCPDVKLATIVTTFSYYNDYSTFEECQGIEEFYLCNRAYSGKIESEEWFLEQVEKYKKGEIENVDIEEPQEKNLFKELFSNELVQITLVIIILIIVFIVTRIYINSKKKIKVNIKKKR